MAPSLLLDGPNHQNNGDLKAIPPSVDHHHTNWDVSLPDMPDAKAQLKTFDIVSRFLPEGSESESYWWRVTGRQVAAMMYEANYPDQRQVELLLFYRFCVVPRLGPKPAATTPRFWSRVAPGVGDGSPIGYSWRWGTGPGSKPLIRHYIEPIGVLTGTPADPLNEAAAKEMLLDLGGRFPNTDLTHMWRFVSHFRPNLADEATRNVAGSSMLVGLEWPSDRDTVDIMAGLMTRAPSHVSVMIDEVFPRAMRDAYGADVSLDCLNTVRDFVQTDPHGSYITVLGTTALDCCDPAVSRFKVYATTSRLSFDHIATVMTLGGRKPASPETLLQLQELWYGLKGLDREFPKSEEPPRCSDIAGLPNGKNQGVGGPNANLSGITFYFDIHPKYAMPHVKLQVDVSKHSASDLAAIEAVTGFIRRRGQAHDAQAYLNVVRAMVPLEELRNRRGLQAFFAFAIKDEGIDITSYFLPQAYRRFAEIQNELSPRQQRRSRFDSY